MDTLTNLNILQGMVLGFSVGIGWQVGQCVYAWMYGLLELGVAKMRPK